MKLILKILGAIVAFIIIAILALVLLFDLNMLKPRIEAAAREQGVDLQIRGDLGWTFWPSIGVSVADISVAAVETPDQPIAQLKQASLLVALRPLFSGNIQVHHVRVDGAVIALAVDSQGTGNWEALTAEQAEAPVTSPPTQQPPVTQEPAIDPAHDYSREFNLAVERISLLNSSLTYRDDQSGQRIAIDDIQLDIRQFNLQGDAFDLSLSFKTTLADDQTPDQPLTVAADITNRVQLSPDFDAAQLSNGEVKLVINNNGRLTVRYNLDVDDLQENLRYTGTLDVPAFNARTLLAAMGSELETKAAYPLTAVSFSTQINGTAERVSLEPLTLQLDKTKLTGKIAITNFETNALEVVLNGDQINVDDYLAPAEETAQTPAPADTGDEILIPLDTIRTLNADIRADLARATVMDMAVENIQLRLTARNGLVTLQQADARIYEGNLVSKGSLDGRGDSAIIRFDSAITGVQLAPVFKAFELDENIQFSGAINANTTAALRGVTMNQLLDSLTGEANISGNQVRFAPLNVEQKFCQLVNLVNQTEDTKRTWENFTDMRELTGKITMAQRVINVETFNAGVHQLVLGVQGKLNLATDEYDFILPLRLLQEESSENGCRVASNYWINRSLSLLRCRGSLEELNPVQDCRPDSKGLTSLTKDFAEFKLRERHGDRIDAVEKRIDDKKDELRQRLDEKVGAETEGQKPRDLLKGLVNKRLERKAEPAPEPAPEPQPEATPETP